MNNSMMKRDGWHTTHDGFRYYIKGGRIIYGISDLDYGSELRMYQYKVRRTNSGEVFEYERVTPLARYYNLTRYVWSPSVGGK